MSRRTVTRFALAGVLSAALAAPAFPQSPARAPSPQPAAVSFGLPGLFRFEVEVDHAGPALRTERKGLLEVDFRIDFDARPAAPMPREKGQAADESDWYHDVVQRIGMPGADFAPITPPAPPLCGFDCCPLQQVATPGPMPREVGVPPAFQVWQTAGWHVHPDIAARFPQPMPQEATKHNVIARQLVATPFCCPLPQGHAVVQPRPADLRFVYPPVGVTAIRCDENGTWWVKVDGIPQPKQANCPRPGAAVGALAGAAIGGACGNSSACQMPCCEQAGRLSGTWVREIEGAVVAATFTGDEMKLCMNQRAVCEDGTSITVCLTLTADYAVTKEGVVHGVITGIDVNTKCDSKDRDTTNLARELGEMSGAVQQAVDTPFSFRIKKTSAGLMVSGLKTVGIKEVSGQELAGPLCGMYQFSKDGTVPAPKAIKPQVTVIDLPLPSPGNCQQPGVCLPHGRYLERHYPQYFPPEPDHPLPRELAQPPCLPPGAVVPATLCPPGVVCPNPISGPQCLPPVGCGVPVPCPPGTVCPLPISGPQCLPAPQLSWSPPQPPNVPVNEFGMMADAFAQMLGGQQMPRCVTFPPAPQPVAQPCPVQPAGVCVSGPIPSLAPATTPYPVASTRSITGTWVREVGPMVYVVKIANDHLTITCSGSVEEAGGKCVTEGMVISAEYHLCRDGVTAVGIITGVDAVLSGTDLQEPGLSGFGTELARVQKSLTDKPLALNVRLNGDVLVIGNVRMPETQVNPEAWSPLSVLGGRYKAGDEKALPKPKPMKLPAPPTAVPSTYAPPPPPLPTTGFAVPATGSNLPPAGVPLPPPAATLAPLTGAGLLPPTEVPTRPASGFQRVPSPATSPEAAPPSAERIPPLPEPTPTPKPGKKGKKKVADPLRGLINEYSSNPDVRMQQMLYQSEDLRQIKKEWRRFWFNDQPSHLTPERIHGPIIN